MAAVREKKHPKTIATINFKGGVGKTTMTWCLGDYISTYQNDNTIIFDLDAQMSLTQAITLNEDSSIYNQYSTWSERSYIHDDGLCKMGGKITSNL